MIGALLSFQTARELPAAGAIRTAGHALGRWWVAYTAWRIERMTAARLAGMDDRRIEALGGVAAQTDAPDTRCGSTRRPRGTASRMALCSPGLSRRMRR